MVNIMVREGKGVGWRLTWYNSSQFPRNSTTTPTDISFLPRAVLCVHLQPSLQSNWSYYDAYFNWYEPRPPTIYTTTTTRRKRAGRLITSRITALILLLLLEGPQTTHEIVEYVNEYLGTNYSYNLIKQYLYYYRKKGILLYSDGLWSLSAKGEKFVNRIKRWLRRLIGDIIDEPPHLYSSLCSDYKESTSRYNLGITKVQIKYNISNSLSCNYSDLLNRLKEEYGLNNDELDVLRILLEHFAKTRSTYMYIEELATRMETTEDWLQRNVLRRLRSMQLVYVWWDGKVGLGKRLRLMLGIEGR